MERSWLKDALDHALAQDDRPTAVQQFVANINALVVNSKNQSEEFEKVKFFRRKFF